MALPYILYVQTIIVCGGFFYSSTKYCESNNSKCCPALPEAWVQAYADTHAEPLYISVFLLYPMYYPRNIYTFTLRPSSNSEPGSHSARDFIFIGRIIQHFLPSPTRVELYVFCQDSAWVGQGSASPCSIQYRYQTNST